MEGLKNELDIGEAKKRLENEALLVIGASLTSPSELPMANK